MHEATLLSILVVSFLMGITHAFDADHVVAVSSLAQRRQGGRAGLFYAIKWALGHGGILLLVAFGTLYFRVQLPDDIPHFAARLVGVILIVSGVSLLWSLRREHARVRIHTHGDVVHAHLTTERKADRHDHAPILVGVVHGLAGSAPALALIPATLYRPSLGLGYVAIFSLGVLLGMLAFGALLNHGQRFLLRRSALLFDASRALLGIGAAVFGIVWLGVA